MDQEKLDKMWLWVEETAKRVGEFGSEQIPIFIHEYLSWHWTESFINCLIGFLMIIIPLIWAYKAGWGDMFIEKWEKRDEKGFSTGGLTRHGIKSLILSIISVPLLIIGLHKVFMNTDWIKISIAPRVYLLDKAATMIKK